MTLPRKHWTLLAIASARGKSVSPVVLQKSLFLLGRRMTDAVGTDFYQFVPHHWGAFSSDIYSDARRLTDDGLVIVRRQAGQSWDEYSATPAGLREAELVVREVDARALAYLTRVVEWAGRLRFIELVRVMYNEYPEFKVNSVLFKGRAAPGPAA